MKVLSLILNAVFCTVSICGCVQAQTIAFPHDVTGLPKVANCFSNEVGCDPGVIRVATGHDLARDICSKIGLPEPVEASSILSTGNYSNEESMCLSLPSSDCGISNCPKEVFDLGTSALLTEKTVNSKNRVIVLYDCDDVLHKNTDAILQKTYIGDFLKRNKFSKDQVKTLIRGGTKDLVECDVLNLFSYLKDQGIPQFVFTQCSSDKDTRAWRHGVLNELGYDFNSKLFEKDQFEISVECSLVPQLGQSEATPPIYDNGIIFAGSAPKGEVFKAFLNCIYNEIPDQFVSPQELTVIFVDDKYDNVIHVGNVCSETGIGRYLGYNYTAVERLDRAKSPDLGITGVQLEGLKQGVWLQDHNAGFVQLFRVDNPLERNFARRIKGVQFPILFTTGVPSRNM